MTSRPTLFTLPTGTRLSLIVSGLVFESADRVMDVDSDDQTLEATASDDFRVI